MEIANLIDGRLQPARRGRWLENIEPAAGATYGRTPDSDADDVADAVAAATRAFPAWSATPAQERSRLLLALADLVEQNTERLARAESVDTGKPITLARAVDIPRAAANLRFFATAVLHTTSAAHPMDHGGVQGAGSAGALNYTLRKPRGVAGCISPWNLPLYLFTWKIAPALATGNTVVGKPSEVTPATAHHLAELSLQAGFPPGVLNIVHGTGDRAGGPLVTHPDVPTISFTGSTRVGAWISATAGPMFKRLSLELGGKNATILFEDADLATAIPTATRAAFANQGQICLCGSRILAHESIFDRVVAGVTEHARSIRIGDPLDEATQHGSLVSAAHRDKVLSFIARARDLGAAIHTGGDPVPAEQLPPRCRNGYFVPPTVITGLANDCPVIQEEIFGPVATIQPFATEEEAVALANSTQYGLACSIFTQDLSRAHRSAAAVEAGIIWINCWLLRDLRTPFGGMKSSGVGREGGDEALRFFTEAKNVCVSL